MLDMLAEIKVNSQSLADTFSEELSLLKLSNTILFPSLLLTHILPVLGSMNECLNISFPLFFPRRIEVKEVDEEAEDAAEEETEEEEEEEEEDKRRRRRRRRRMRCREKWEERSRRKREKGMKNGKIRFTTFLF